MKLIDPKELVSEWSYPDYGNPFRVVAPAVDNHMDSESYSPLSLVETWAKCCEHRIETVERNGFGSRV